MKVLNNAAQRSIMLPRYPSLRALVQIIRVGPIVSWARGTFGQPAGQSQRTGRILSPTSRRHRGRIIAITGYSSCSRQVCDVYHQREEGVWRFGAGNERPQY